MFPEMFPWMLHEGKHIQETCGIPKHFCTRHWGDPHQVAQGEVQSPAAGEEQPHVPGHAEGHPAGKQLGRKDLEVLVITELNMSHQCALPLRPMVFLAALGKALPAD